jgi:hypothetical protein
MANRHHQSHPPTGVKPNQAVNKRPEAYAPPEKAAQPNSNPSLGPVVGLDGLNQRRPAEASAAPPIPPAKVLGRDGGNGELDCDPDMDDDCPEDASLQIS